MSVIARVRTDERGFTLVELLTAMLIGLVILGAGLAILDRSWNASAEVSDRAAGLAAARSAMAQVTRDLRSQVCLGANTPIIYGDQNRVRFYADISDGSSRNAVEIREIAYDASARTLVERVWRPTGGTYPNLTYPAQPTATNLLLERAWPASSGAPIFDYYAWDTSNGGATVRLGTPLSASDAARTIRIVVSFQARPSNRPSAAQRAADIQNEVFVRSADNTSATGGPSCA
ncbi:MAG: prepilin-type N-terminal cleavage/methylation domain-containing protein [Thermoleophilum sp.]|nr:prepilin-type N-terminal cleavage/methylation domain-containing protein [Thermoleophilum sp.]